MNYNDFRELANEIKSKKPILFELEHDEILSLEDMRFYEEENGFRLPENYRLFLSEFGGGYFGFTTIYSLDENSDFCILKHRRSVPENYLPISDNGCGDYYMLKICNGQCSDELYFWNHSTDNIEKCGFTDVLEYLLETGLKYRS